MRRPGQKQVLDILDAVLAADPAGRDDLLRELCGDDEKRRLQVESMLALETQAERFLDGPAVPAAGGGGERIGPYRIIEPLARGGMGSVYRAVREDDFEKQVAIKLIRPELAGAASTLTRRFEAERQILAPLDHPSIARLLDGGTTADGRPYLVMDYVDGVDIGRYCDEHALNTRERLELFLPVLDAVAYAHQNLVVHRDLKPGNILVTASGVPKLLDFGIAKFLDTSGTRERDGTVTTGRWMTPRYASPEQIAGTPVTTASDVYGLGVVLYQLLTGHLPCGLDTCGPADAGRQVLHTEPVPPSAAADEAAARLRAGDARRLRRQLKGDIDAILLKALAKEVRHRYASVEQLAADLRRHLEGAPIQIRQEVWLYRAGKLLRRYKWAAAVAVLILTSSFVSTALWLRAEAEIRARERAEKVVDVLQRLVTSVNPNVARGSDIDVREILKEAREQFSPGDLEADPDLEAWLAGALGQIYRDLGIYDVALELLERAVEVRRELYPEGHERLVLALNNLASDHYYVGNYQSSVRYHREALEMRQHLGQEPVQIALSLSNLASALKQQGLYDEAGRYYREALALREQIDGPDTLSVASSLYALGALEYEQGVLLLAEDYLRRAFEIRIRELGEDHTRVVTVMNTLGRTLHARGELTEAEDLLRRSIAGRRELLGEDHLHVALSRRDLAAVLLERGEIGEAGALLKPALDVLRRSQAPDSWRVASVESVWGAYLAAVGRLEKAKQLLSRSHTALAAAKGESSIYTRQAKERAERLYGGDYRK